MRAKAGGAAGVALAAGLALIGACSRNNQITAPGPAVTLTGCLQPGTARDTYRLTGLGAPTGPVGTRGVGQMPTAANPTGTASRSRTADEGAFDTRLYTLVGGKSVDLAPFQGEVVRVTGYVEQGSDGKVTGLSGSGQNAPPMTDQQSRRAPNTAGGANATTGEGPDSSVRGHAADRPLQTIRVDKIQRVRADCSADTK